MPDPIHGSGAAKACSNLRFSPREPFRGRASNAIHELRRVHPRAHGPIQPLLVIFHSRNDLAGIDFLLSSARRKHSDTTLTHQKAKCLFFRYRVDAPSPAGRSCGSPGSAPGKRARIRRLRSPRPSAPSGDAGWNGAAHSATPASLPAAVLRSTAIPQSPLPTVPSTAGRGISTPPTMTLGLRSARERRN